MMSELLYFNGINGATGTYGVEPMTGEEFYDHITRERYEKPEYSDALEYRRNQERLKKIDEEESELRAEKENLEAVGIAKGSGGQAKRLAELEAQAKGLQRERRDMESKGVKFGVDPNDLAQSGWGMILGTSRPLASQVEEALKPLLDLRKGQTEHFQIYKEGQGYASGWTAGRFLAAHGGARLADPADPDKVPYYLLIVGSPEEVPYSFQYQLDVQYAVGRIDFGDDLDAYANYARNVARVENGTAKPASNATFFGVANPNDRATKLSTDHLLLPLYESLEGKYPRWQFDLTQGDEATKANLLRLMSGPEPPSLLFTASHGMEFPVDDPKKRQVPHQGALLCQDWPGPSSWRGEIPQDFYLAGDDLTNDVNLLGLIAFFFACYGAGTPLYDEFSRQAFKERRAIVEKPFTAALPRAMLSLANGALAVIGHIERTWSVSFLGTRQDEQTTVFESAIAHLLQGYPVGSALEYFNSRHAALSTQLTTALETEGKADYSFGDAAPDPYEIAAMWTANNDARGYVIIGDPAVHLPVARPEKIDEPGAVPTLAISLLTKPTDAPFTDKDWRRTPPNVQEYIYHLRNLLASKGLSPAKGALSPIPDKYAATTVTPHLEAEISSGRNLLYCATFQVAWDQLRDDILDGHPIQLESDPPIVQALNHRLVGKQDISAEYYLAMAGFGRDRIVERIARELQRKFDRTPGLDLLCGPDDILAYAFLEKSIPFDTEFQVLADPLKFSDGVEVQAFGVEQERGAADQVAILDYRNADDFIIRLQGSPQVDAEMEFGARIDRPRISDDIILAKVAPQATLRETVEAVLARASEEAKGQTESSLGPQEVLRIPKIDVDILHRYTELVGKPLLNKGFEGYPISEALQAVEFKLDETGAKVRSEAAILVMKGIILPERLREFVFDKPFLLCLKEKEARYPYLAIWVDNSELLVKA
jgi:hypothetical protein